MVDISPGATPDLTPSECPKLQYMNGGPTEGCVEGLLDAPCSSSTRCFVKCAIDNPSANQHVDQLIISMLAPNQIWSREYPSTTTSDTTNQFLTNTFFWNPLTQRLALKQTTSTLAIVPNMAPSRSTYQFPPLSLLSGNVPPDNNPPMPVTPTTLRSCPTYPSAATAVTKLPMSSNNIIFNVNYIPTAPDTSSITILFVEPNQATQAPNVQVILPSIGLTVDYLMNKDSGATDAGTRYIVSNYIKKNQNDTDPFTPATQDLPPSWTGPIRIAAPPMIITQQATAAAYYTNSLKFDDITIPPPLLHFFYYPASGEVVTSKFLTLPFRFNGGLVTLVGMFSTGNRVIVSTMTLFADTSDPTQRSLNNNITLRNMTQFPPYNYSLNQILVYSSGSSVNIYASIYSFVFIDFPSFFPFTANMSVASPPKLSEAVGYCTTVINDVNTPITSGMGSERASAASSNLYRQDTNADYLLSIFRPYSTLRGQSFVPADPYVFNFVPIIEDHRVLDYDMIVIDEKGSGAIVGIVFTLVNKEINIPFSTYMATLRFGYILYTNEYSLPIVTNPRTSYTDTRIYTFYYTPDAEETGGELKDPSNSFAPTGADITAWITPWNTVQDGSTITHDVRSPWASEVFTLTSVPYNLTPPVRFHRAKPNSIYIVGNLDQSGDMIIIPIFFDNLGSMLLTNAVTSTVWNSLTTVCPVTSVQQLSSLVPGPNDNVIFNGSPIPAETWVVPNQKIVNNPPATGIPNPIQLNAYMCESEGFPDGIIYKGRPYIYRHDFPAIPPAGSGINYNWLTAIQDFAKLYGVTIRNMYDVIITSMFSTLPSQTQDLLNTTIRYSYYNTPTALGFTTQTSPLMIPQAFGFNVPNLGTFSFALSQSTSGLMAEMYKFAQSCIISGAIAFPPSPYPTNCVDFGLFEDPKPLPIMIGYANSSSSPTDAGKITLVFYNIELTPTTLTVVSVDKFHLDNTPYLLPIGSANSPAMVYSGCT